MIVGDAWSMVSGGNDVSRGDPGEGVVSWTLRVMLDEGGQEYRLAMR